MNMKLFITRLSQASWPALTIKCFISISTIVPLSPLWRACRVHYLVNPKLDECLSLSLFLSPYLSFPILNSPSFFLPLLHSLSFSLSYSLSLPISFSSSHSFSLFSSSSPSLHFFLSLLLSDSLPLSLKASSWIQNFTVWCNCYVSKSRNLKVNSLLWYMISNFGNWKLIWMYTYSLI